MLDLTWTVTLLGRAQKINNVLLSLRIPYKTKRRGNRLLQTLGEIKRNCKRILINVLSHLLSILVHTCHCLLKASEQKVVSTVLTMGSLAVVAF